MTPNLRLYWDRRSLGLNQYQLSEKLGISQSVLCEIETGKRAPTPEQVAIVSALASKLPKHKRFYAGKKVRHTQMKILSPKSAGKDQV